MSSLQADKYERAISSYLPSARIAFIDEVFKANSAILNSLLTILNERLFDQGAERIKVPLLCLVGASNELPESEELEALYDRFLVRKEVGQVSEGGLMELGRMAATRGRKGGGVSITSEHEVEEKEETTSPTPPTLLTMDDFISTPTHASLVSFPPHLLHLVIALRIHLQTKCEPPVYISDRRFMRSIRFMQMAALSDGRCVVNESDVLLLQYVFAHRPSSEGSKVRTFLLEKMGEDEGGSEAEVMLMGVLARSIRWSEGGGGGGGGGGEGEEGEEVLRELREDVDELIHLLSRRYRTVMDMEANDFNVLQSSIWLHQGGATSAIMALGPLVNENKKRLGGMMREVLTIKTILSARGDDKGEEGEGEGGGGSRMQQGELVRVLLERMLPKRYRQYSKGVASIE